MTSMPSAGPLGLRKSRRRRACLAAGGVLTLVLTACGGGSDGGTTTKDGFAQAAQSDGPLTVWVDSTRLPAAQLYQKQHPDTKLDIVTYDGDANGSNYLQTKVGLFNRTGSGWPDVVFSSQNNEATWAATKAFSFTAPLNKGLLPQSTLDKFAPGANDPCTVDGTMHCLRNDLSQVVLWYNKPLLDQFGYQVPATWEQYQALGEKVAAEHPGYLVGDAGDTYTPEVFLWAGKCGANQITGAKSVKVDTGSANCTRMASMMDTLIQKGSMSVSGVFSTDFGKNKADKILMMPGPAWYGGALFKDTFKNPAGQIAVAPLPQWTGESAPSTGNVGGGTWLISSHSAHLKAAVDFLAWVTTADDYQGDLAPGYPAYGPAATTWLAKQKTNGYYANDVTGPLQSAASQVWPGWGYGQFSQEAVWAATVKPGLTSGKSIVSMLPSWADAITDHAKAAGYEVSR